jgi:DNA-binding MarR family transcriptional regulator
VRIAHTTAFPHIDLEGTRLTDLAQRLGVTKQAAGQLIDELEEMGIVERAPDPADARAKLVRFSKRGLAGLMEGLGVLAELEAEMRDVIGDSKMHTLHEILASVLASLEETEPPRAEKGRAKKSARK